MLSAMAVSPGSQIHVADNSAFQIFTLGPLLPQSDEYGNTRIVDAVAKEIYSFNRFGQHLRTFNLDTGTKVYDFTYSKSTGFGRLLKISDSIGNKITLQRDYTNRVQSIENTFGQKYTIKMDRLGVLQSIQVAERQEVQLTYVENSFMLETVSNTMGDLFFYTYDLNGRLTRGVAPTGEAYYLEQDTSCLLKRNPGICYYAYINGELFLNKTTSNNIETFITESSCNSSIESRTENIDVTFSNCVSLRIKMRERVLSSDRGMQTSLTRVPQEEYLALGETLTTLSWVNSKDEMQMDSREQNTDTKR
jgi:hypothetical protein